LSNINLNATLGGIKDDRENIIYDEFRNKTELLFTRSLNHYRRKMVKNGM
jgi:hypothetical protein